MLILQVRKLHAEKDEAILDAQIDNPSPHFEQLVLCVCGFKYCIGCFHHCGNCKSKHINQNIKYGDASYEYTNL